MNTTNMKDANYYKNHLELKPHPEGGYYRETYSSNLVIPKEGLPEKFETGHTACTAIFYLLSGNQFSAFHRIKSDELWHFYDGNTLLVHVIDKDGTLTTHHMGRNIDKGEKLQAVVYAGAWFGAQLLNPSEKNFALVGCTVAPGFNFEDLKIGEETKLAAKYPQHKDLIEKLTHTS